MAYLIVFIGSGIGGTLRHGVNVLFAQLLRPDLPFSTLFVNISGSLLMGLFVGLVGLDNSEGQDLRLFFATGLLGGFTTFSAFSLDIVTLYRRGEFVDAVIYSCSSLVMSVVALIIGLRLARWLA